MFFALFKITPNWPPTAYFAEYSSIRFAKLIDSIVGFATIKVKSIFVSTSCIKYFKSN